MSAVLACPVPSCTLCFLKKMVQYIDRDGKLITESLIDYTKKNVLNQYATLDDFLSAWEAAERKEVIINEMEEHGCCVYYGRTEHRNHEANQTRLS